MKIGHLVAVALAASLLFACEQKSTADKVGDSINDALDRRPAEGVQDAVEDVADAAKKAAEDSDEAAKKAAKQAQ